MRAPGNRPARIIPLGAPTAPGEHTDPFPRSRLCICRTGPVPFGGTMPAHPAAALPVHRPRRSSTTSLRPARPGLPWSDALGARVVTALRRRRRGAARPGPVLLPPDRSRPPHAVAGAVRRPGARPRHPHRPRQSRPRPPPRQRQHVLHAAAAGALRAVDPRAGAPAGDGFVEQGGCDLKTAFALPLPLKVISHIVGIDPPAPSGWAPRSGSSSGPRTPIREHRRRRPSASSTCTTISASSWRSGAPTGVTT